MAFEDIYGPLVVMFMLAIFLFLPVYILDVIRQRVDPKGGKKIALIFGMSYLLSMAFYPFAISEDFLPFNSTYISYFLVLLFIVLVYLVVFNKTKE